MNTLIYSLFKVETINIDLEKQGHIKTKIKEKNEITEEEKKEVLEEINIDGDLVDKKYKYYTFPRSETYNDRFW